MLFDFFKICSVEGRSITVYIVYMSNMLVDWIAVSVYVSVGAIVSVIYSECKKFGFR